MQASSGMGWFTFKSKVWDAVNFSRMLCTPRDCRKAGCGKSARPV